MVRRFVEQQHVRVRQQQTAERDAALFAARQRADRRIPGRQPQGLRRDLELAFDFPAVGRFDRVLQLALFGQQSCHLLVTERFGESFADLVEPRDERENPGDAFLDHATNGLAGVELRFLREVADPDARLRPRFAIEVPVDARHDPEQRRLAGAVQAQDADLRAGKEAQADVAQDMALRRHDFREAVRGIDVLGHGPLPGAGRRRAIGLSANGPAEQ